MSQVSLRVRQPHFADDMWYSSAAGQLQPEIKGYFASAPSISLVGEMIGLVAPHAGYFYSGHVAGAAFSGLTPGAADTVVLIGPDHRGIALNGISTPQVDVWRTPLGEIPVNWELLEAVRSEIPLVLLAHDNEHSLEIELPFLQMALQQFKLAPLMMGDQSPDTCSRLGKALVKVIRPPSEEQTRERILLVASSDLSHYFDDQTARQLDQTTLQFILNLDAEGLVRHVEAGRRRGQPYACGAGPIAVVIHAAKGLGATQAILLKYATSADAYPRTDRVVGYAAVAISR
jgi:hypothetical protein